MTTTGDGSSLMSPAVAVALDAGCIRPQASMITTVAHAGTHWPLLTNPPHSHALNFMLIAMIAIEESVASHACARFLCRCGEFNQHRVLAKVGFACARLSV